MNFSEAAPKAPLRKSRTSLAGSDRDITILQTTMENRRSWMVNSSVPTPPMRRSRVSLTADADDEEQRSMTTKQTGSTTPPARPPPPSRVTVGYATVDKQSLLVPPQSPMRHRRKKSYDVIKSQEFGAFFTIPRSYNSEKTVTTSFTAVARGTDLLPPAPPSRPTRAYNTLGPSRPLRRRLPVREHEYGDLPDDGNVGGATVKTTDTERKQRHTVITTVRSSSLDDTDSSAKALYSGDVIEKMKLRPLPSPPAPPRKTKSPCGNGNDTPEQQRRRNTDSALVPFLDRRETSATSSDDFFADVSRALLVSTAKKTAAADDVSIGVQTDPLLDGYDLDDVGSCCSTESNRPTASRASSTAAERPLSRASAVSATNLPTDRPVSRMSTNTEYVDRPTSRIENGYAMVPNVAEAGVVCAQRLNVSELQVGKMIVADIRSQRIGVDHVSGSILNVGHIAAAAGTMITMTPETDTRTVLPNASLDGLHDHQLQDDTASVPSSRVSSMYPEVDSDEDRSSVLAAPTPPRRRSKPTSRSVSSAAKDRNNVNTPSSTVDLTAANASISELSCQLFRLCHSNVCSLFKKVVQQVVPEDTEKRRDLQAALCFLSIILAGLLILGFGNEKTIHHHHWDFQFPPPHQ